MSAALVLVGIDGQAHEAAEGNVWGWASLVSDRRWNGWAVPFFTMAECERIAAQSAAWNAREVEAYGAEAAIDSMSNVFTWDADRGEWLEADPRYPEEGAEVVPSTVLPDGSRAWALGNGYCWSEAKDAPGAPLVLTPEARAAWADGAGNATGGDGSPVDLDLVESWGFGYVNDEASDGDVNRGAWAAWVAGFLSAERVWR